ncbi:MAG: hypothetical protein M3370_03745 [Actinomycetota bacterium]|nr:hypothetical protein [Actinomycetota bacterium]
MLTTTLTATVEGYLDGLEVSWRRVAQGEWGLTLVDVGGRPLHVGLALRDGLLRAQAQALDPDRVDDHELLHRNRGLALARYTHAGDGTVWVEADLPPAAVDATWVDRLLGAVVEAATVVRWRAGTETEPEDAL